MSNRILYGAQSSGPGRELAEYVNAIFVAVSKGRRLKAKLDAMSFSSDWAAVAAEIGGGITAVQAQTLWTIFSTAQAQVDSAQIAELARLDQG